MVSSREVREMIPQTIDNLVNGQFVGSASGDTFVKLDPARGVELISVPRSREADINSAVESALNAQSAWATVTPVARGELLHKLVRLMQDRRSEIAAIVAAETGKSFKAALGETDAAIALGLFMVGEGMRLYARTTTSAQANRQAMTIRQPVGVAGLIIAANTPIANVAWKVFPALICGNTVVLKSAEDTPATAWYFSRLANEVGVPNGVLNVVHGLGVEAGAALVAHPAVPLISFTGSERVGRLVNQTAASRLAKVSLELGGKNPFVVCDDADLTNAVQWAVLSAFSNSGQRCAAGSRIIVMDAVYDRFVDDLVARTIALKIGTSDTDDLGPVINERQLINMLAAVGEAIAGGAHCLVGGNRLETPEYVSGFYMAPTLLESVAVDAPISSCELFGPIACLYRVKTYSEALALANNSPYGLTACIHTSNHHRAQHFVQHADAGVVTVNGGTFGSEPHMPFGGSKNSGNGSREPGTEAIDFYTHLKDVYVQYDPSKVDDSCT
jgi:alpha-ketoglutaric semialdehyde dehydrogenase